MPDVDVIVVNFHTPEDLETFCQSLDEQTGVSSITIVNNEPRFMDRSVANSLAKELGARVLTNEENVGYARAVNAAAVGLTAPILAIFNSDVRLMTSSITAMADFLDAHDEVGIAGPKQVDSKGRITHGGIVGTNRRPVHRSWHRRDTGQCDDVLTNVVTVSGSAYFVKRACWDELTACPIYQGSAKKMRGVVPTGAFLPTPLYYEETFCSVHAVAHGWKNAYNGKVKMIHEWQGSSKDHAVLSKYVAKSRQMYRQACADHGIIHE